MAFGQSMVHGDRSVGLGFQLISFSMLCIYLRHSIMNDMSLSHV